VRPCNVAAEEFSLAAMLRDDLAAAQEAGAYTRPHSAQPEQFLKQKHTQHTP